MRRPLPGYICLVVCLLFLVQLTSQCSLAVESAAPGPNSDPVYQQLRNVTISNETVSLSNVDLKRDAATFHFHSGTICFLAPVAGKVTGAVFIGEGTVDISPPIPIEVKTLRLLSLNARQDEFSEDFNHLMLRFTDSTYDDLKKLGGNGSSSGCDNGLLVGSKNAMRHNKVLKYNLDARILQDVLSPEAGGLFLAFIHGKKYNDKEIYVVDPHGAPDLIQVVAPEEVELVTYDENKLGVWTSFHLSSEYAAGRASGAEKNFLIHIDHQEIETTIEGNAHLTGKATTTFTSLVNGLRVVPFNLFHSLRVQNVTGENGLPLSFIQEDKNDDADFSVILPRPLSVGEKYAIVMSYGGKDAIINEGGGNYYPVARENWYPNNRSATLGEYTTYDLTFRIPKGMKMAATGRLLDESLEGNQSVSHWRSEGPVPVAGFQFGRMKVEEAQLASPEFLVQTFANDTPPDYMNRLQGGSVGTLSTVVLMKKPLAEAQLAVGIYNDYFGPVPFKRLAMTQQTACDYGQAWPELVWLPICSFFDSTVRHQLGLDFRDRGYWKIVTPHEIAHQWWGQTVGFNSFRDQWMSEGFADFSASLFMQQIYGQKSSKDFLRFWDDEREMLLERNREGFRAIDAGPLTLGYRLSNTKTGTSLTRSLIYPKGAYILHMIRMMMWDRRTGDQHFKEMMREFVKTFGGRAATTEDFKTMVERHMTPEMDIDGNHRLDWFFNEYVYGTALPSYKLDYSFASAPDGVIFTLKLSQSNVDEHFKMLVPIYVEMADGKLVSLGRARMLGNTNLEQKVPLKGFKEAPKRAVVNYYYDVLAAN